MPVAQSDICPSPSVLKGPCLSTQCLKASEFSGSRTGSWSPPKTALCSTADASTLPRVQVQICRDILTPSFSHTYPTHWQLLTLRLCPRTHSRPLWPQLLLPSAPPTPTPASLRLQGLCTGWAPPGLLLAFAQGRHPPHVLVLGHSQPPAPIAFPQLSLPSSVYCWWASLSLSPPHTAQGAASCGGEGQLILSMLCCALLCLVLIVGVQCSMLNK